MLLTLLIVALTFPPAVLGQLGPPSEVEVREVLEKSQVGDFLASLGQTVVGRLPQVAPELDSLSHREIREAVSDAFSPQALARTVTAHFIERSPGGELQALRAWLLSPEF